MDWGILIKKAGQAILTFLAAQLTANTGLLAGMIPENIAKMTVGGLVAAIIVAAANWLKHRAD